MEQKLMSEWKDSIRVVIISKVNELRYLGYDEADETNVWQCLMKKVWKKDRTIPLHQIVEDVLHLKPHLFMSYMTQMAYQTDDLSGAIRGVLENNS